MASTYSPKLRFELIGAGEQAGLWGNTTNKNVGQLIEQAIAGVTTVELDGLSGNYTLTALDGAPDQSRSAVILCTYAAVPASAAINLIIPTQTKLYVVRNDCGQTVTVKTSAQVGGVIILNGESTLVFCDGTDALAGIETAAVGTLTVSGGGTGVTTFGGGGFVKSSGGTASLTAAAAVALGSEVSGTLPVANGGTGVSTTTAYGVLTGGTTSTGAFQNAGTGSSGQVLTSNGAGALPTWQPISGGVTSFSAGSTGLTPSTGTTGAVTLGGTLALANGGTGASTAPNARTNLGLGSLATLNSVDLSNQVSNVLPATNGGTGVNSAGISGNLLVSNGSAWVSTVPYGITHSYFVIPTSSSQTVNFPLNATGLWQVIADFRAGVDDAGTYDFTTSVSVTALGSTTTPGIRFQRSGGAGYGRFIYGTNIGSMTINVTSPALTPITVGVLNDPQSGLMIPGSFGLIITCVKIS